MYLARLVAFAACLPLWCSATNELMCSFTSTHDNGPIQEGTFGTFSCNWTGPDVDNSNLNWYRISSSGEDTTPISSTDGAAIWRIAGLDNGVEFLCVGQNRTSLEVSRCTLMPFVVPPTATVENFGGAFVTGKEASFICKAEGIPAIAGYHWFVDSVKNESHGGKLMREEDGKIAKIEKLMTSDNGSVVTCEAYVPSGLRVNASLTIDLIQEPYVPNKDRSMINLWIFIACAAAGGIPVVVLTVVCFAWCLRKTYRSRRSQSKKRSQSRRHIVLNEEQNEPGEPHREENAETTLNERAENGATTNSWHVTNEEDDGTHPPPHKPAPPPSIDPDNVYVNTPAPTSAATLPVLGRRSTSPPHYSTPRSVHQRKKTEYENVTNLNNDDNHSNGDTEPQGDVYENVAPSRPLSPKPKLEHTSSLPNFLT